MFNPCLVIPVYRHAMQLKSFLPRLFPAIPIIIVDDGNEAPDAELLRAIQGVTLVVLPQNQGKGGAVIAGLRRAAELGYSHALQLDADGQHNIEKIPLFLDSSREHPADMISGYPVYDGTVPKSRKIGREITNFWVRLETGSDAFKDAMCGFRVYPLDRMKPLLQKGLVFKRMGGDVEILVKVSWLGINIRALPVEVSYPQSGFSNFRMLKDNIQISLLHTMLVCLKIMRILGLKK